MKKPSRSHLFQTHNRVRRLLPFVLGLGLACVPDSQSALRTWDGSSSGNWSTAANWVENVAPVDGDDVVFPVANTAGAKYTTNNLSGLDLRSVTFYGSNYWNYGQLVHVAEGITAYNRTLGNYIFFPVTLDAAQAIRVSTALSGTLSISTNVNLNGYDLIVDSGVGELYLNGILSGTGDLRKEGSGDVWFGGPGPNTYVGSMMVAAGTLYLNKLTGPGITGAITNSGTILYYRHSQMLYQRVMLNAGSVLDLGNYDDIIGPLLMRGGTARTITGTLTLGGNITNYASSSISTIQGTLSLGSASRIFHVDAGSASPDLDIQANITGGSVGFTKTGSGTLYVQGTNTYSGYTYLADGPVRVYSDMPFGDPGSGVVLSNDASMQLVSANVTNSALTLIPASTNLTYLTASGFSSWAGPVVLSNDVSVSTGGTLTFSNRISGPGRLTLLGATYEFAGTNGNYYEGETIVHCELLRLNKTGTGTNQIAVPGDLFIGGTSDASNVVKHLNDHQIDNAAIVTLYSNAVLNLNGYTDGVEDVIFNGGRIDTGTGGQFRLYGDVAINSASSGAVITGEMYLLAGTRQFVLNNTGGVTSLRIYANVTGSGLFSISGAGQLDLRGDNSYTGETRIDGPMVSVYSDTGLGSGSQGTVVSDGQLYLNSVNVASEPLTLDRSVSYPLWTVGACAWGGPVVLQTNVSIHASGSLVFSNTISGPGGIRLTGDTIEFTGSVTNIYAGVTTVNCEFLLLNHNVPGGGVAISGDLVIGGGTAVSNVVKYLQCCQLATESDVTFHTNGVMNLNEFNDGIGGLTFNGGRVDNAGSLILYDDVVVQPTNQIARINGVLSLNGTRTFDVGNGTAGNDLVISARISNGSIIKEGLGILYLGASNSFSGSVTVNESLLWVADNHALGNASGNTIVNSGGTLFFSSATDEVAEPITLNGSGGPYAGALQVSSSVTIVTNLDLATDSEIYVGSGANLTIEGVISGSGDLTKEGTGTLTLAGSHDNTYTGETVVSEGVLVLAKTGGNYAVRNGQLTIGRNSLSADPALVNFGGTYQLPSNLPILVNHSGRLDFNGFNGYLGPLDLYSAAVSNRAPATIYLYGNVNVHQSVTNRGSRLHGTIQLVGTRTFNITNTAVFPDLFCYAQLVGSGGIRKLGAGAVSLYESNAYAGSTLIGAGNVYAYDSWALGQTNGGTVVSNGANLVLSGYNEVAAEALTLTGTGIANLGALASIYGSNYWGGNITLDGDSRITVDSGGFLYLNGAIGGTGNLTKEGDGQLILAGSTANAYVGTTYVNNGGLILNKTAADGGIPGDVVIGSVTDTAFVRHWSGGDMYDQAHVHIRSGSFWDLNNKDEWVGLVSGEGSIYLGASSTLGIEVGHGGGSTNFDGVITGTGSLTKVGTGTWTLNGNNTLTGPTAVNAGTLVVNGSQPSSPVTVASSGTLSGSGTIGNLAAQGNVAPGTSTGTLTTSNVVFSSTGDYYAELSNTGLDQLNVRGIVTNLGNATLHISPADLTPREGDEFIILRNDGTDAITGTFAGLAEGALVSGGPFTFRISYVGGNGNDVVLTYTNSTLRLFGGTIYSGNRNWVVDANECDLLSLALRNTSGAAISGVTGTLTPVTPGVAVTYPFSVFPDFAVGGIAANSPYFQFTTWPGFEANCGTNVAMLLTLQTATNGTFTIPVTLPSGSPGLAHDFTNITYRIVGDLTTITSTIPVTGISRPIAKVTVGLWISHPNDSDLDMYLVGPDGTRVELSTDNGGSGENYGIGCALTNRTIFMDNAPNFIPTHVAPFVGYYSPEGHLADFRGMAGAAANGDWQLVLSDDTANALGGELHCWYLTIYEASCTDGGGVCQSCPDRTIYGSLTSLSQTQNGRLTNNGVVSACGPRLKLCPGTLPISSARHYDAYTFVNGESNACVTVTLTSSGRMAGSDLFSAAYLNSFNPARLCDNYRADIGDTVPPMGSAAYSFEVPPFAVFVVTVNEVTFGTGGDYVLSVTGGSCRPKLNITDLGHGQVQLDWTSAAVGYDLIQTNTLATPPVQPWTLLDDEDFPQVIKASRVTVTNSTSDFGPKSFYELRKR